MMAFLTPYGLPWLATLLAVVKTPAMLRAAIVFVAVIVVDDTV
jgi:hypothetical protein